MSVGLEGGAGNRGVLPTGPRRPVPSLLDSSLLPGVMAFPFFGGASVSFAKALIYSPFDLGAQGDTAAVTATYR